MARLQQELQNYNGYKDYTITLNTDLNLNNKDWTPIGNNDKRLQGKFNGNSHTISNLKIDSTDDYKALFGYISYSTVKNLTVTGANVKGGNYVGILVGYNNSSTIENCKVQGSVESTYNFTKVGGIVGYNGAPSIVENCTARANITSGKYAGGIIDYNNTTTKKPTMLTNATGHNYRFAELDSNLTDDTPKDIWTVAKSTATYSNGTPTHYTLDGDKITYTATEAGDPIITITGVKLKNANIADAHKVTVSSTIGFVADFSDATITGSGAADTLTVNGANISISAGKGDDVINLTGANIIVNADDGKDTILGGDYNDKLYGEVGDDSIDGGAGDDSLWGGTGNDTLTGGEGSDTFIYANGDGQDVITDFDSDDLLEITGAFSGTFDDETNTLTLKVGKTDNAITLVTDSTTFNINGANYHIDGDNKLVK